MSSPTVEERLQQLEDIEATIRRPVPVIAEHPFRASETAVRTTPPAERRRKTPRRGRRGGRRRSRALARSS